MNEFLVYCIYKSLNLLKKTWIHFGKNGTVDSLNGLFSANINGLSDDSDISNAFSKNLSNIYFDSYNDKAETSKYFDGLQSNLLSEFSSNIDTRSVFDVCDVKKSLNKLKIGKACGLDNITKEFVMYSHPAIVVHLKLFFNIMIHHGFVPDSFGNGVIIPLVKDKQGVLCNIDNYRGITLSLFLQNFLNIVS